MATPTITFRTTGVWGSGIGVNLTPAQVDTNFYNVQQAIANIELEQGVGILSITQSGTQLSINLTDGTTQGPFNIPLGIGATRLDGLDDVELESEIEDGHILQYNQSNGLWVSVAPTDLGIAQSLQELNDVVIESQPAEGDVIAYDSEIGQWRAQAQSGGGGGGGGATAISELTDVNIPSEPSDGEILRWNASTGFFELEDFDFLTGAQGPQGEQGPAGAAGASSLAELSDVEVPSSPDDGDIIRYSISSDSWVLENLTDLIVALSPPSSGGGGGGATSLSELSDVELPSEAGDGEVLRYSISSGRWIGESLIDIINAAVPAVASPYLPVVNASGSVLLSASGHAGKYLVVTTNGNVSATIRPQSETPWPDDAEIVIEYQGSGSLEVVAGSGVTLNIPGDVIAQSRGDGAILALKRTAENVWSLTGDLAITDVAPSRLDELNDVELDSESLDESILQYNQSTGRWLSISPPWYTHEERRDNPHEVTLDQAISAGSLGSNIPLNGNWLSGDGGNEGVFVDGDGNVGIGTSSPSSLFQVDGEVLVDSLKFESTVGSIAQNTSDGNDFGEIAIAGGGSATSNPRARGAYMRLFGNENSAEPGGLHLYAGNLAAGDIVLFTADTQERIRLHNNGDMTPGSDNSQDLGSSSLRFQDAYVANGVTTTSDRREKEIRGALTEKEISAGLRMSPIVFRWISAIEEKGFDNARLHTSFVAQEIQSALIEENLDPGDYAFFVETPLFERVKRKVVKNVTRPKTELKQKEIKEVEIENGEPVIKRRTKNIKVYSGEWKDLKDGNSYAKDSDGKIIKHFVKDVETVKEETWVSELNPVIDKKTGKQKTRFGLRISELLCFLSACQSHRIDELEYRLDALEKRRAPA